MDAPIPIIYGEEEFRQRILERTGGTREPLGLVLSGGSARAFAHIGVLARLEESGIVPDFIVANSMGSIVGLLYAAGFSPAQIKQLVTETELGPLFSPVVPLKGGILDVSRFSDLVRAYLGERRLEDLPIPILICTEDLVTKREVRLAEGDFYTAMEAAYALPVYFSPVPYGQHLLIDGGITNLLPLGVAYGYTDTVIVSSTFYDAPGLNLRNPLIILNTAIDIGKRRAGVADLVANSEALWIRCDVEKISFMAFDAIDLLADAGYRSADAMAPAYATLPAAGLDPVLLSRRNDLDLLIPGVLRDWNRFQRTPAQEPELGVSLSLASRAFPGDRWLLSDALGLGAALGLRSGALEAKLCLGADWEPAAYSGLVDQSQRGLAPAASADLAFYPLPALAMVSSGTLRWESQEAELSGYIRNGLHVALVGKTGRTRIDARSLLEHRFDGGLQFGSMLLTSSVEVHQLPRSQSLWFSLEAGHQLAGNYDRHLGFARAAAELPLGGSFSVVADTLVRGGLQAGTMAPLFLSDGFGTADSADYSGLHRILVLGGLALQWSPQGFKPSFGELIILKKNSVGLYADALWRPDFSNAIPVVAGIRLNTDASLIGLKSGTIQLELGCDVDAQAVVFRAFLF